MTRLYLVGLALIVGGLIAWYGLIHDASERSQQREREAPNSPAVAGVSGEEAESSLAAPDKQEVDDRAAANGAVRWVNCRPEGVGLEPPAEAEMLPTVEAVELMEECFAKAHLADPSHAAIKVSVVYYLEPDGSIAQTGCGADVRSEASWAALEGCVLDYWTVNPPAVGPTDEKTFTCEFWWSKTGLLGGLRLASPLMLDVWFGQRAIGGVFEEAARAALPPN